MACLTRLRSLSSWKLEVVTAQDAQALHCFTALQGLTHLGLDMDRIKPPDEMLAAVAQLTGLASLNLSGSVLQHVGSVLPLVALQQLTSLTVDRNVYLGLDDALALASLGQLRRLEARFGNPAAAAAAGLDRLEECKAQVFGAHEGAPVSLAGRVELWSLHGFDLSRVHTLSLFDPMQLRRHLSCCQQLRALSMTDWYTVLQQAVLLQAVAALPQLQHLHHCDQPSRQLDCSAVAVLAGCRQLKQLTLEGMVGLLEGTVGPLPRLRLLRLLG
jgi:hypothetical protein